jgi:5,10-methylenetetrahydromethanopterin reductase
MTKVALPDIGLRLSGAVEPRQCIELAQAAENAGFASVWFAENPFQRGVMATAGACAVVTKRVRIGVGVVNPFGRHPTLIVMEFATLHELSEGRAVLGIGSGVAAAVRRMGFTDERPVTALREAIAIIRTMLSGDTATLMGKKFNVDAARLGFAARAGDLPIYMAAAGDMMLKLCGEIADGLIISNLTPPRTTERLVAIAAASAAPTGRPPPRIVQYVPCALDSDSATAHDSAKALVGGMLAGLWPTGDDWPRARERIVAESGIPRREFAGVLDALRRDAAAAAVIDERFIAAFAIAGTAPEAIEQSARYGNAGVDELVLTFAGPRPSQDIAEFGAACGLLS